jgi:transglycosylase-like protein
LRSTRLSLAAVSTAALLHAGIAFAGDPQQGSPDVASQLRAPIAGHATIAEQMRAATRERVRQAKRRSRHRSEKFTAPPALARIAECESHSNPRSIGGGGMYRGAYQFSESTWASVGGKGDPVQASMQEQTRRAAMLYQRSGASQWPVCAA